MSKTSIYCDFIYYLCVILFYCYKSWKNEGNSKPPCSFCFVFHHFFFFLLFPESKTNFIPNKQRYFNKTKSIGKKKLKIKSKEWKKIK